MESLIDLEVPALGYDSYLCSAGCITNIVDGDIGSFCSDPVTLSTEEM